MIDRESNVAHQGLQQRHFVFIEEIRLFREHRQDGYGLIGDDHRQRDDRANARFGAFLAIQGPGIMFRMIEHDRGLLLECLRAQCVLRCRARRQGLFDESDELRILARRGGDGKRRRARIDQRHYAHAEPAGLDHDPARLIEQIVADIGAKDQRINAAQHRIDTVEATDIDLGRFQVVNIRAGSKPSGDGPLGVSHRRALDQPPAVNPIRAAYASFQRIGCDRRHRMAPSAPNLLSFVRMERLDPTVTATFFDGQPRIVRPARVKIIIAAIHARRPDDLRHGFSQGAQLLFTFSQRFHNLPAMRFARESIKRKTDVHRQLTQEAACWRIEKADLVGIDAESADDLAPPAQRKRRRRGPIGDSSALPPWNHDRIMDNVLKPDRPVPAHRLADRTAPERRIILCRDLDVLQISGGVTPTRNRPHLGRLGVDNSDPRHIHTAELHRDPADFREQFFF